MRVGVEQPQERRRAPVHYTDGARIEKQPARSHKRYVHGSGKQRFDRADVADKDNGRICKLAVQFLYQADHSFLELFYRFASGRSAIGIAFPKEKPIGILAAKSQNLRTA